MKGERCYLLILNRKVNCSLSWMWGLGDKFQLQHCCDSLKVLFKYIKNSGRKKKEKQLCFLYYIFKDTLSGLAQKPRAGIDILLHSHRPRMLWVLSRHELNRAWEPSPTFVCSVQHLVKRLEWRHTWSHMATWKAVTFRQKTKQMKMNESCYQPAPQFSCCCHFALRYLCAWAFQLAQW